MHFFVIQVIVYESYCAHDTKIIKTQPAPLLASARVYCLSSSKLCCLVLQNAKMPTFLTTYSKFVPSGA